MEQLTRWLAQVLCLLMMGSILLYVISPASVFDYAYEGAWRGVTINKNTFGGYMAIAVIVLLLVRFRHFGWLRYVFLVMAAILLLFSHSATSLVGCILIISIMPLWHLMHADARTRRVAYVLITLAIGAGIYFVWVDRDVLFRVLGRDASLTGRTDLWLLLMSAISKHPLLGYGYGAFWSGMQGEALNVYIGSKWLPTGAHNGYLELLLGIGLLGLPLLLYFVLRSFGLARNYIRSNEGRLSLWPMSYLLLFIFHNFFESHLLETRSLEFLMFAAITTSLAMECSGREPRQAPAHPPLFASRKQPA
jgi:O-antigen ligase